MPHFRVDDALHSHPKAQRAGDEALGMWARAGSFCMAYLTDGFVPEWWIRQQPKGMAKAKRLIAAGLWHGDAEKDGEPGFMFHEFTGPGRQDSREQIEADREKWRKKKQRQRETAEDSLRVSTRVSPGDTSGESPRESWVLPNTNPEENSGYLPESATDPNARDSAAATPGADLVRAIIPAEHPDAVKTALRLRASELINRGTPTETVAAALRLWLTKPNLGPNTLPALVSEVIKTANGHARAAPTGQPHKLRAIAELAQAERARENQTTLQELQ